MATRRCRATASAEWGGAIGLCTAEQWTLRAATTRLHATAVVSSPNAPPLPLPARPCATAPWSSICAAAAAAARLNAPSRAVASTAAARTATASTAAPRTATVSTAGRSAIPAATPAARRLRPSCVRAAAATASRAASAAASPAASV